MARNWWNLKKIPEECQTEGCERPPTKLLCYGSSVTAAYCDPHAAIEKQKRLTEHRRLQEGRT